MKKFLFRFGISGIVLFTSLFIYCYKTSGRFRQSIIASFAGVLFAFGSTDTMISGFDQVNAFRDGQHTCKNPRGTSARRLKNPNFGSGSGGGDGDGNNNPQFPKAESIEETEGRINRIDSLMKKMKNNQEDEETPVVSVSETVDKHNSSRKIKRKALKDSRLKKEYESYKQRLEEGVNPIDLRSKKTTKIPPNFILIKGKYGRYLVRQNLENNVDIVGVASRSNILDFKTAMKKLYGVNLKYTKP